MNSPGARLLLALALILQGCGLKTHEVAEPTPRIQTIRVKVTRVERADRELNGFLWAELRFVANDGNRRYHFFTNCRQDVNDYHCEFFTPTVGQKYVIELHREPSQSFCTITDNGSSTGLTMHYYREESEESMSLWSRVTE
jgi:hypothetical protein